MIKKQSAVGLLVAAGALVATASFAEAPTAPHVTIAAGPGKAGAVAKRTHRVAPPAPPPLSAAALASAKLQAKGVGAPAPGAMSGPLTLDTQHWNATSGAVSGDMDLGSVNDVNKSWGLFAHTQVNDQSGSVALSFTGLKKGELLLLDCRFDLSTSGLPNKSVEELGNAAHGPQIIPVENGHVLYAFPADDTAQQLVFLVPTAQWGSAAFYGCTLHPVN